MQEAYKTQAERVVQFRKRLAEVEARRNQYEQNVPFELWQEFADVSRHLELAEGELRKNCDQLVLEMNQARLRIVSLLEEYNHVREQMRQVEGLFLANIVRPGYRLKQAISQRKWLEREYRRIQIRITRAGYTSLEELQADIHSVLAQDDAASELESQSPDEEKSGENDPFESLEDASVEDVVDALSREKLVREFKRVVLPKVHPDTSDTPVEVFKTVYEVYKRADSLLMEAYIVEYRGEIRAEQSPDLLESLDRLLEARQRLQRLSARLQRRIDHLKQDLTSQEKQEPGKIQENMQQQRQEILASIRVEAEQILVWREKIAGLLQEYRDLHAQA
jgi:hypothetical protein